MEIEEMKELCEKMFIIKEFCDRLDKQKKELTVELNEMKKIIMVEFEKNNMKNFRTNNLLISQVDKKSVKIIDKNLLLDYLEEKGILRDSFNVTAATATTIWNQEYEIAKENNDVDFIMNGLPGLSEPATHTTISMRGK